MMPVAEFDGDNLIIKLPSLSVYDGKADIYSEWKRWSLLDDNLGYPQAFDTTGGDPLGPGQSIAPYFFCRNDLGWRIETPDDNGDVTIVGNVIRRDTGIELYQQASGFTSFLQLEVSPQAIVVETTGSALTPLESANIKLIPALL